MTADPCFTGEKQEGAGPGACRDRKPDALALLGADAAVDRKGCMLPKTGIRLCPAGRAELRTSYW